MKKLSVSFLLVLFAVAVKAQFYGQVIDAANGEPIPFAAVKYIGTSEGRSTDINGNFVLPILNNYSKFEITSLGYKPVTVTVPRGRQEIRDQIIKMYSDDILLGEVVVKKSKINYKRKNNPAVDLMRKVIANKRLSDIKEKDFYHFDKYEKKTFSYNDIKGTKDTLLSEICPETGKLILPIMVEETSSEENYRKNPKTVKTTIHAKRSDGFQSMLSSGDMITSLIKDIFTDVDIYKDNVRLLQHPFISPISTSEAIGFYHYYIQDTIMVDNERCIDVVFLPNNTQDFGFSGHLFITDDKLNQVKRAVLNIPNNSGVNFVDNLMVIQDFMTLPTGERVMKVDNMVVELSGLYGAIKFQCQRYTSYSNYNFNPITDKKAFKSPQTERVMADAEFKDSTYWASIRPIQLTNSESHLGNGVDKINNDLGAFKKFLLTAVVENSIELTPKPNKIDFIPLNAIVSHNEIDGWRYQGSLQTTGNLSPHLFLRGYGAYGTKDEKWKYKAEVEYSFNKKKYMAHEFPRRSITASFMYDDMSPVDKYSGTIKDNMYSSFKTSKVDQMMYVNDLNLKYQYETDNNITWSAALDHSKLTPTGKLVYMRNADYNNGIETFVPHIRTSDVKLGFRYAPRETFINSKQQRIAINKDAPIFTLEHTMGIDGFFEGQYNYNITEATIFKKFWLPGACGSIEAYLKGGHQWNKVPFPMLFTPQSNLSYFVQFDSWSFNMLRNMEFLNDSYASLFINWSFDGKVLNRIPLLKKMKLREYIGFKMLYGHLSDRNNPFKQTEDNDLFVFPTRDRHQTSFVMGNKPYMELSVGISNIFKVITVQYVRRLSYNDMPDIYGGDKLKKNGIRFAVDFKF
ncbi:MAG: carboxypeptidase-like regulatory domain-containing protein [Bacteroidaceae bacterium]|nr:carboxypeptidase-like regulatory domain-containing protein [Bacteroidaceae bacterium]